MKLVFFGLAFLLLIPVTAFAAYRPESHRYLFDSNVNDTNNTAVWVLQSGAQLLPLSSMQGNASLQIISTGSPWYRLRNYSINLNATNITITGWFFVYSGNDQIAQNDCQRNDVFLSQVSLFDRFTLSFNNDSGTISACWVMDNEGEGVTTLDLDFDNSFLDSWVHFAFVYSTGNATIYMNGTKTASVALTRLNLTDDSVTFGADAGGTSSYRGQIDDFRVWENTTLSQSEILEVMLEANDFPVIVSNNTNVTSITYLSGIAYYANASDDDMIRNLILESNVSGMVSNTSLALNGTWLNATFNSTSQLKFSSFTNWNVTYFKLYVVDHAGHVNESNKLLFNISFSDGDVADVFENSSAVATIGSAGNILVNVSDLLSNISSVTVEVRNDTGANGDRSNFTMTLDAGTNTAGQVTRWLYSYTPSGTARVQCARYFVTDFIGNVRVTPDCTTEWSVAAAQVGGGSGGGGGSSDTFLTVNQTTPHCGDNKCTVSIGEDILSCPQDCSVGLDFSGLTGDIGAIPKFILLVVVAGTVYLFLKGGLPQSLKVKARFKGFRKKFKVNREGFFEAPRLR